MIIEIILFAIILMILIGILWRMMKISLRVFGIGIAVLIIFAILGYIL